MTYAFSFGFLVTDEKGSPTVGGELEQVVDELMGVMLARETDLVFDASVGATITAGEVDVDISVALEDEVAAAAVARDFVIETLRAIGGTPMGIFVFPPSAEPPPGPRQQWHERKAEITIA